MRAITSAFLYGLAYAVFSKDKFFGDKFSKDKFSNKEENLTNYDWLVDGWKDAARDLARCDAAPFCQRFRSQLYEDTTSKRYILNSELGIDENTCSVTGSLLL